jgi:hypothetical protein
MLFHTSMIAVYEKYDDTSIGSPLLFVCSTAYVKNIK